MRRSRSLLALVVAAASLACSDDTEPPGSGSANVEGGGQGGAGGATGGAASTGGSAGKGAASAGSAGGTSSGGSSPGNAGSDAGSAGDGGSDAGGAGKGGAAAGSAGGGGGDAGSAGASGSADGGGGAGAGGIGGSADSSVCVFGEDPEALLVLTGGASVTKDGTVIASTPAGTCFIPPLGASPTLITSGDPAVTVKGAAVSGSLVALASVPGNHVALWHPGMTHARVTSIPFPQGFYANGVYMATGDGKRAVVTFQSVTGYGGNAFPVWLVGLEPGIPDVLLEDPADAQVSGGESPGAQLGSEHTVERVAGGIVLASYVLPGHPTARVRSIADDGTVRVLCETCQFAPGLSPSSPWVPTTAEGSHEPRDPVVLRHAFTNETKWVDDAFILEAGQRFSPAGDLLYATNHSGQLVRYTLATGAVITVPEIVSAYHDHRALQAVSDDGSTVQLGQSLAHFSPDGGVTPMKDLTPHAIEGAALLRLAPGGRYGYAIYSSSNYQQLREGYLRIDPVAGTVHRILGLRPGQTSRELRPWSPTTVLVPLLDGTREIDLQTGLHRPFPGAPDRQPIAPLPDGSGFYFQRTVFEGSEAKVYLGRATQAASWESGPLPCAVTKAGALLDNAADQVRGSVGTGTQEVLVVIDEQITCAVPVDGSPPIPIDADDASLLPMGTEGVVIPLLSRTGELRVWKPGLTKARIASAQPYLQDPTGPRLEIIPDGSQIVFPEVAPTGERLIAAYDFAKDQRTVLPGAQSPRATAGAVIFRRKQALPLTGEELLSLQPDGSIKTLCVGCTETFASTRSPWVLTTTATGTFGDHEIGPSYARLIHSVTGQTVDVSTKLRKGIAAAFSDDGKALFTSGVDNGLVRYWVDSGVVEKLGTLPPMLNEPDTTPIWPSADGAAVLFLARVGNAFEGTARLATGPSDVRDLGTIGTITGVKLLSSSPFTRDGTFALFDRYVNGGGQRRAISTALGGVAKDAPYASNNPFLPMPRPSGARLLTTNQMGGLDIVDLGTGAQTPLVAQGQYPYAIEGGTRVVYEAEDRALRVIAMP